MMDIESVYNNTCARYKMYGVNSSGSQISKEIIISTFLVNHIGQHFNRRLAVIYG